MPVGCATVLERCTCVDVRGFQKETATAMETNSTPLGCVEGLARLMPMPMAFVTTSTHVSVLWTNAVCATVPARSTTVDAPTFLKAIAIAMETKTTPWACAVAIAARMKMPMASATTWTTAWVNSMRAVSAMAQERFTTVDVPTSQQAIAIAMEISSMPSANVEALVKRMTMPTVCATTWTIVWAPSTSVASATVLVRFTNVVVQTFQPAIAIATAINSTPLGFAGAIVWKMWMRTACATPTRCWAARMIWPATSVRTLRKKTTHAPTSRGRVKPASRGSSWRTTWTMMESATQTKFRAAQTLRPATSAQKPQTTTDLALTWMASATPVWKAL